MTESATTYRWSRDAFVRAYEADAFEHRVELVDGEVWSVAIGDWHGDMVGQVMGALPRTEARVTGSTLPAGDSLPDPDLWVRRAGAVASGQIGNRLSTWDPADVLLVVEVSDETLLQDLNVKARLYGAAGFGVYWVIAEEVIYEHTNPTSTGYKTRNEYRPGERIPVGYAQTDLAVADLLSLK